VERARTSNLRGARIKPLLGFSYIPISIAVIPLARIVENQLRI
jgi:hypothetical protein